MQVSSNFLSLPLLAPYQSVVFHVHIGKRFQFRNELLDFFLGRLWQYNSPARVSSYVHQLGAASSDKRHHFFMVKLHQRFCRYHCGVIFTVFFLWFPSGLVLYYIVSNLVTIIQQQLIYRGLEKRGLHSREKKKS